MRRREFVKVITGFAVAWPRVARAQQPSSLASSWKNIVPDYSAVGDGTTVNDRMFRAHKVYARKNAGLSQLIIPPGDYKLTSAEIAPFDGIKQLIVSGYGATLPAIRGTCMAGFPGDAMHSARVKAVSVGATSVTLVTPSEVSRFSVGDWCALDALEMMSAGGYPPNHHYIQFVKIIRIDGPVIWISPAANEAYKTTYPLTSSGGYDTGGPATLHVMVPGGEHGTRMSWDTDATFYGLTFKNRAGPGGLQVYFPGRRVRVIDCVFDTCAPIATTCQDFMALRVTVPVGYEVENDKQCESVIWDD